MEMIDLELKVFFDKIKVTSCFVSTHAHDFFHFHYFYFINHHSHIICNVTKPMASKNAFAYFYICDFFNADTVYA